MEHGWLAGWQTGWLVLRIADNTKESASVIIHTCHTITDDDLQRPQEYCQTLHDTDDTFKTDLLVLPQTL